MAEKSGTSGVEGFSRAGPPSKADISLEEVLQGQRCSPLSLAEFESFAKHQEHSLENVQFYFWLENYRQRFFAQDAAIQASCPAPPMDFYRPASVRYARSVASSVRERKRFFNSGKAGWWRLRPNMTAKTERVRQQSHGPTEAAAFINSTLIDASRREDLRVESDTASLDEKTASDAIVAPEEVPYCEPEAASSLSMSKTRTDRMLERYHVDRKVGLPFAKEVGAVVHTFFLPHSSKELNLESTSREKILHLLAYNSETRQCEGTTHPDVFLAAADAVWTMMEDVTLPNFLRFAETNTNGPKSKFWYIIGAIDVGVGLLISLLLLFLTHARWWRIFGFPFILFGSMQIYSAALKFCSVVNSRGARQMYPWELEASQDDVPARLDSPKVEGTGTVPQGPTSAAIHNVVSPWDEPSPDLIHQCPWLAESIASPVDDSSPASAMPGKPRARRGSNVGSGSKVPVFGPEKALEDPYVAELHRQVMNRIYCAGGLATAAVGAALLAVPMQ
ncbi:uncharacterized protein L969DRAFT_92182 [Mixia osmundae IAM 14324]|uniref:RGS domain-containing protein n=1 Tax=Mixia osmundae (strain CBS 9802 / IAM 14324 / JCM 22182 / KY 12970) TaxID=764103 RepID=G7DT32_MIXOS|nr:uncharacterized protein L969DRAFT_92182 [Mixia osmundae IAM 14324]KEI42756.1 hypothetical protein L969DRAFT_92182 [Mixia osmundae IAM 14324]GAA93911.1 hypothetical protein E5Q_00557 [Mixia osmundae IAM 14324]